MARRDDKGWKVFIGNLNPDTQSGDLRDFFRDYGTCNDAWVARKPPGFGFVWLEHERDAVSLSCWLLCTQHHATSCWCETNAIFMPTANLVSTPPPHLEPDV
jgi:hypothetical protein